MHFVGLDEIIKHPIKEFMFCSVPKSRCWSPERNQPRAMQLKGKPFRLLRKGIMRAKGPLA